jgi:hypothetical protein
MVTGWECGHFPFIGVCPQLEVQVELHGKSDQPGSLSYMIKKPVNWYLYCFNRWHEVDWTSDKRE